MILEKKIKRKSNRRDKHYHCMTQQLKELSRVLTGNRKILPIKTGESTSTFDGKSFEVNRP